MFELLSKSGAYHITLSVDSFRRSEEYWHDVNLMIRLAKDNGIKMSIDLMTGFPRESKKDLLKTLFLLVALIAPTWSIQGCHTWEGFGRDIERTGEKMQGEDEEDFEEQAERDAEESS